MEHKLAPLTMNQTNWPVFVETFTELFGVSPTRVLDDNNIKLDTPNALYKCLRHHLDGMLDDHSFFSFVGTADAEMLVDLSNHTRISIVSKESTEERNVYFFIASANLQDWKDGILNLSSKQVRKNTRKLGNNFLMFLEMAGFKIISNSKQQQKDGTYIL